MHKYKYCIAFLFFVSIAIQAQASTGLGWASPYFLPPGQAQTSLVEWESYNGTTIDDDYLFWYFAPVPYEKWSISFAQH